MPVAPAPVVESAVAKQDAYELVYGCSDHAPAHLFRLCLDCASVARRRADRRCAHWSLREAHLQRS